MSDDRWWKEKHAEYYFEYEDEILENERQEVKELVEGEDGVYRVVE